MRIRTAILGYGRSGSRMHAGAIERNDAFQMTAVCDIEVQRQNEARERFNCTIHDDYRRMLAQEQLSLVVIVTRSDQHCQITCDCLESGVNVLVTKPWAVNEAEARRMVAASERSGKLLLPWLPARWGCDLTRLRELMAQNAIGNVFLVRRAVSTFDTRSDWQTERRCGGGYLLNWGPHIVDPPVVLMGSRVTSVYGRMKQMINPGDVEDVFLAVINLASGAIVHAEFTISVEGPPSWVVQGDQGTIVVREDKLTVHKKRPTRPDDPTLHTTMQPEAGETTEETLAGALFGDEHQIYAEVASAVRGERPFPVTPADALELTRVLDAIRVSSEENRVVTL